MAPRVVVLVTALLLGLLSAPSGHAQADDAASTGPAGAGSADSVSPAALNPPGAAAIKGKTWGAPTTSPSSAFTRSGPVFPATVAEANADDPPYYDDPGCHLTPDLSVPGTPCRYGDPRGTTDVWVLGDSKVGQWFVALDAIARREGWRLTMHTKSGCPYAPSLPLPANPTRGNRLCKEFNLHVQGLVRQARPDIVITASVKQGADLTEAYVRAWREMRANGTRQVVALWDSPSPSPLVPPCLEPLVPQGDYVASCSYRPGASGNATLKAAVDRVGGARLVSMADWVCPTSTLSPRCPPVIGQATVYRGGSHLSTTYVRTLTDALHERLYRAGVATHPPEPERVERIGGANRFHTAALLSEGYPEGQGVIVTSGLDFPDALSAAARAGATGVPVLLTRPGSLPADTRSALQRLRPSNITIVGGEGAVTAAVEDALRAFATDVERVAGTDRYQTSAAVARLSTGPVPKVYVATGASFPDALAAASLAGHEGVPVLLTRPGSLPSSTADALMHLNPGEITVVGGPNVVADSVLDQLQQLPGNARVTRVSGSNRYATAAALTAGYQAPVQTVYVALGTNYPDALAAAARAGREGAPVLLAASDTVPAATATALNRLKPQQIVVTGGPNVLRDTVRWGLERYLR